MNFDKLEGLRMDGSNTPAAQSASDPPQPRDTATASDGVHFGEHGIIKSAVEEKVYKQKTRSLPTSAVGKSADIATASVKHGAEELLELLTTPEGQKFVRSMSANVVEGYVQASRTQGFKLAAKENAAAGYSGTLELTSMWMQGWKEQLTKFIDPRMPGAPLLRWAGVFIAVMAAGSFTLLFSTLLLVWKVILF